MIPLPSQPAPPPTNPPTREHFYSLLSQIDFLLSSGPNFRLYWQHVELYKRGYLVEAIMTAGIRDKYQLLSTPEIRALHQDIVANEYRFDNEYERMHFVRLVHALEAVFSDEGGFENLLLTMELVNGQFQMERRRRGLG
jgi:hypothetical protein